jgi:hypothetical protein
MIETAPIGRRFRFSLAGETVLKHRRSRITLNFQRSRSYLAKGERETAMIKIGSKEEIALLLALYGVLDKPGAERKQPKRRSQAGSRCSRAQAAAMPQSP